MRKRRSNNRNRKRILTVGSAKLSIAILRELRVVS